MDMDQLVLIALATLTLVTSGVSSLRCYQCYINPPAHQQYNASRRLCMHFDHSDKFIVDCPESTMCMKQEFSLDIQDGVRIHGEQRDCAFQRYDYQEYVGGSWHAKTKIMEPYQEGCINVDDKGARTPNTRYCYCRQDLCNSAPKSTHEGYTDIMGVILVFNLMKYIRSLR